MTVDLSGYPVGTTVTFTWNTTAKGGGGSWTLGDGGEVIHDNYCDAIVWYAPMTIINDTSEFRLYSWSVHDQGYHGGSTYPDTSTGWVGIGAGARINVCPGPFTNKLVWWIATPDHTMQIRSDGMLGALDVSNVVVLVVPPSGWQQTCSSPTIVYLSGRYSVPVTTNQPPEAVNYNTAATNSMWVNTNLSDSVASQLGSQAIVDAINRLGAGISNSSGGGGGGTVVVTNTTDFGQITNQLNAMTNLLTAMDRRDSNTWHSGTNTMHDFKSGAWTNGVNSGMAGGSNTMYGGVSGVGNKASFDAPTLGSDKPSDGDWQFPLMKGERLPWSVPWSGGQSVSGPYSFPGITFPTWVPTAFRAILAIFMVLGLWYYVLNDAITQLKFLMGVGQIRVMKGQILGTSFALPVSLTLAAVVLAIMFAVPAAQIALMETGIVATVGTVATSVASISSVASGQGVWGLFLEICPAVTMFTVGASGVIWFAVSNSMVLAVAAVYKAFVAD